MDIILPTLIITSLLITVSIAQNDCPVRNASLTTCERSCATTRICQRANRQCECAGECGWSCIKQECPSLSAPQNGNVTINPTNRSVGSEAAFSCNAGYFLQGVPTRVCHENKVWSDDGDVTCTQGCVKNSNEVTRLGWTCARPCAADLLCKRRTYSCKCDNVCGMSCVPTGEENFCDPSVLSTNYATFTIEPPTAVFGSIAKYVCRDGFVPVGGDSVRVCTGGRGWSGTSFICDPAGACEDPPVIPHATHNGTKDFYLPGELLVYSCDHGYYGDNNLSLLLCQRTRDTAAWGNINMTCLPKSCGPPESIIHGMIVGNIYSFPSSVTYECNAGYRLQGFSITRYCQANQQWSGSPPSCIQITDVCNMPEDTDDWQWQRGRKCRAGQDQPEGCELTYTCNKGFDPANTGTVYVCSAPQWVRTEEPMCRRTSTPTTAIQCPVMSAPSNGQVIGNNRGINDEVSFICNNGFILDGASNVTCQIDGSWSSPPPICRVGCLSGWLQYGDYCYKFISPPGKGVSFEEITNLCESEGPYKDGFPVSYLADIQSEAENDFVAEEIAEGMRAWIGGTRVGGYWYWQANVRIGQEESGITYTNWKWNEPNNHLGQEDCIEINRGPSGRWNDLNCHRKRPGVCKYAINELGTP